LYTSIPTIWQLACIRQSAVTVSETSVQTSSWEAPGPIVMVTDWLVFSPWAGFGRNQSPVRLPVWLWHAAFWASS
jgi:hypothetical protein